MGREPAVQSGLDPHHRAVALAQARQPGGDDLGVVEHDDIAGTEERRQIADDAVVKATLGVDDEHPRRVARAHGPQGDQPLRQVEVEVAEPKRRLRPPGL